MPDQGATETTGATVSRAVLASMGSDGSRLGTVVSRITRDLHRAIADLGVTEAELKAAIAFMTEVGHTCTAKRQEWVLLADVIGISTLVIDINRSAGDGATPRTLRGPFYRGDAPIRRLHDSISLDGLGDPLTVAGRVLDAEGAPIAGAVVETWQANRAGLYENQDPDRQPEFNLRGVFQTDACGHFAYRTVRPGPCRLPADGPVRRLVEALGMSTVRPAHLNFRISASGFQTLVTHVFDRDDPAIEEDAVFSVHPELLGRIEAVKDGPAHLEFDFRLSRLEHGGGHIQDGGKDGTA